MAIAFTLTLLWRTKRMEMYYKKKHNREYPPQIPQRMVFFDGLLGSSFEGVRKILDEEGTPIPYMEAQKLVPPVLSGYITAVPLQLLERGVWFNNHFSVRGTVIDYEDSPNNEPSSKRNDMTIEFSGDIFELNDEELRSAIAN